MSATNRGGTRAENDVYRTPEWVTDGLFQFINWGAVQTACEPCKGDGAIYDRIPAGVNKTWYEISDGRDYLTSNPPLVDLTVTNPPYKHAMEFVLRAMDHSMVTAMLLRLNFLGSIRRHKFFMDHPPDHLVILSKRPSFTGGGTDATEYAWFIWKKCLQHKYIVNLPQLWWIQ